MVEPLLILIVATLAGARTWRLLAHDTAGEPVRRVVRRLDYRLRVKGRDKPADLIEEMWECPFCLGFWVTSLWWVIGYACDAHWLWLVPAGAFAANFVGAQLNAWLDVKPVTDHGGEIEGLDG